MYNYEDMYSLLIQYLKNNQWDVEPDYSSDTVTLWVNQPLTESILLPNKDKLDHFRAERTIEEAFNDLADIAHLTHECFKELLTDRPSDQIYFRANGTAIGHGRINFRTNHILESTIYSIIVNAANKLIAIPAGKKKRGELTKAEAINTYLNSVNSVAPSAGSFIYNLDVDLTKSVGFSEGESLQRYVNTKLAKALNELYLISNVEQVTTATLIKKGLNESLCRDFVKFFSNDIETIECNFNWDASEEAPKLIRNNLVFNRKHKEIAQKLRNKFTSTYSQKLKGAAAQLSELKIKEDFATVLLKVHIKGAERSCNTEIDLDIAQNLLKTLGEDIQQPVLIDATVWIEKKAQKNNYSLSDITAINSEKGKNLTLFK